MPTRTVLHEEVADVFVDVSADDPLSSRCLVERSVRDYHCQLDERSGRRDQVQQKAEGNKQRHAERRVLYRGERQRETQPPLRFKARREGRELSKGSAQESDCVFLKRLDLTCCPPVKCERGETEEQTKEGTENQRRSRGSVITLRF